MMMMQYYKAIRNLAFMGQILFKVVYPTVYRFTVWPADVFCNWWIKHTNNGCLRKCVHLPGNLNFGGYHDIYNLSRNSMVHTIIDWSYLFIVEIFHFYALNIYLARSFIHNLSFSNSCWLFVWYFRTSVRYFIILTFNNCFLLCIYMEHCFIITLNFLNFYFMCENPFLLKFLCLHHPVWCVFLLICASFPPVKMESQTLGQKLLSLFSTPARCLQVSSYLTHLSHIFPKSI